MCSLRGVARRIGRTRSERRQAEASFAKVLLQRKHTLVMFYSRRCPLCSQLRKPLAALEEQHSGWLAVARLCADDEETWALEARCFAATNTATGALPMRCLYPRAPVTHCPPDRACEAERTSRAQLLHYAIDYVPSFVLLNPQGEALAKTVRPRSPQHLIDSLHLLVERAQQAADNPG